MDEFLKHVHLHLLRKSGGVVEILWKSVMMADADIRPTLMLLGHQISDRSGFLYLEDPWYQVLGKAIFCCEKFWRISCMVLQSRRHVSGMVHLAPTWRHSFIELMELHVRSF